MLLNDFCTPGAKIVNIILKSNYEHYSLPTKRESFIGFSILNFYHILKKNCIWDSTIF